jgi:REP element-mobilizing transposase RayT
MRSRSIQLGLSLPPPRRWGGRRAGSGRKPVGPQAGLPHASRAHFAKTLPAHVTLRLRKDLPSLRTVKLVRQLERTFAAGCERPGFRLVHYSLQGNHAHLIVEAHDRVALGRGMMAIGIRLARAVNRVAGRKGPVLADRYHLRLLPTPREVRNALRYVLLNARRHAAAVRARLSAVVRLDPASSGRWFDGWNRERLKDVVREDRTADPDAPTAVARARTWLLTVGWRRYGLLDPAEVPG